MLTYATLKPEYFLSDQPLVSTEQWTECCSKLGPADRQQFRTALLHSCQVVLKSAFDNMSEKKCIKLTQMFNTQNTIFQSQFVIFISAKLQPAILETSKKVFNREILFAVQILWTKYFPGSKPKRKVVGRSGPDSPGPRTVGQLKSGSRLL